MNGQGEGWKALNRTGLLSCVCIASCLASTLPYFAKIDLVESETKLESSIKQEQSFP